MVARKSMDSQTGDPFTERIYALENRRFYKGVPGAGAVRHRARSEPPTLMTRRTRATDRFGHDRRLGGSRRPG